MAGSVELVDSGDIANSPRRELSMTPSSPTIISNCRQVL
jgi:hypothetical protein